MAYRLAGAFGTLRATARTRHRFFSTTSSYTSSSLGEGFSSFKVLKLESQQPPAHTETSTLALAAAYALAPRTLALAPYTLALAPHTRMHTSGVLLPLQEKLPSSSPDLFEDEETFAELDSTYETIDACMKAIDVDAEFPEDYQVTNESKLAADIASHYITDATRKGHKRIIKAYILYHLNKAKENSYTWDPKAVTENTPFDITAFITKKCGKVEDGCEGRKMSTAVSTRAALTYYYRLLRPYEPTISWSVDSAGLCRGLPTRSRVVHEFISGLERMKARDGETPQSTRAINFDDMQRLYKRCVVDLKGNERREGITVYLFAFLLMLRIDEVINLDFECIEFKNGASYFEISHKTRKNAQTGCRQNWFLHANDVDTFLCPLRALMRLAILYGEKNPCTGPLFLQIKAGAVQWGLRFSSSLLGRALMSDLQQLGYLKWALYGTHSFRRGGCQYRLKRCGWSIDMVAAWGGWSQQEAATMFRYFYSPNDNHEHMFEYDRPAQKRRKIF
ncbi:hypothetical protein SCHPADRAFT_943121 [Schizopora paradoxa]|uniref:Tyr recombinase domain-containing protein n=1 Tax=Schizopora paradoxa TaxID=27342 RepID=A0A0H2RE73_9AGAM|nr:hypothetical protein SCHPADRAFT_943121 [Schizopora paradoxa]